jgi:molecular chaperone GrpE
MADPGSTDSRRAAMSDADGESTAVLPEGMAVKDEADQLRLALAAAEEQARVSRDQALRAVAELENIRKRAARDIEQAHRYAVEKLAQELLPVRDSLELAVANGGRGDPASLVAGQEATLKLLARAFEKFAIQPLDPVGEPFDPERHEAMVMQESATAEPDSVLTVVQRGYELNGRLLRPARVIVARAPT